MLSFGKISVAYTKLMLVTEILIQPDGWIVGTSLQHTLYNTDVQAIVKAVGLIGGGAGMQSTSTLTKDVASATYASVSISAIIRSRFGGVFFNYYIILYYGNKKKKSPPPAPKARG